MAMGKAWSSYDAMAWNRFNRMGARYVPRGKSWEAAKIDGKITARKKLGEKNPGVLLSCLVYIYIYVFAWDEIRNE